MNIDMITKVILPISTFILGIIFTLALKRYEQRKTNLQKHVEQISNLVNGWYGQLLDINVQIKKGTKDRVIETSIYEYVNNRKILPDLVRSLEIIKKYKGTEELVGDVERFLSKVTNYDPESPNYDEGLACAHVLTLGAYQWNEGEMYPDVVPKGSEFDYFLKRLDRLLQKINREVAEILA